MADSRKILANNLKYLMNCRADLDSQAALARRSGVAQSTISRILRGDSDTGVDTLDALAKVFKVESMGLVDPGLIDQLQGQDTNIKGTTGLTPVPLISWVQAGMYTEAIDLFAPGDAEEILACPFPHGERAFALRVSGPSMLPDYRDGEIILVDPDIGYKHGSDVVVRTPDSGTTFKRIQVTPDGTYLMAVNPDFPNRVILMPEGTKICGVVIASWTDRRI